jgi:FkbM family methyltransferase
MYHTRAVQSNKLFAESIKLYERIKVAVKPSVYKDNNSKEYLPYILNAAVKGYTVLDIGSHKRSYFFDLLKISRLPGRLIAFETSSSIYSYLQKMKRLIHLENITIEDLTFTKNYAEKVKTTAATIIDFTSKKNKDETDLSNHNMVDNYCFSNCIVPALIKFKLEGNELTALYSAKKTLKKYQPQILLECSEGIVIRKTLLKAFKFLTDLNYSGYFILDELKIPLTSFDFNIYQNEVLGFYCNNFIFE